MYGWQKDIGCVSFDNLMEDLATLEISRAQVWQWLHHKISLDDGNQVSEELIKNIFMEEEKNVLSILSTDIPNDQNLEKDIQRARETVEEIFIEKELRNFLTLSSDEV